MANRSVYKTTLNNYKRDINTNTKHKQNYKNPESTAVVLGRNKFNQCNVENEDLLPADNNFEIQNVYIINDDPKFVDNKIFNITREEFALKEGYTFGNIGTSEFRQLYKFGYADPKDLDLMLSTPKIVVTSQNQKIYHNNKPLYSYKIFLVAPELYSKNAPELKAKNLPTIYALDIMYHPNNPNLFRLTLQALVAGCSDGLFNLMILDYNDFEDDHNHKLLGAHIHSRSESNFRLKHLHFDKKADAIGINYETLENAIAYMLEKANIHYSTTQTLRNEKVKDICESLVDQNGKLKTTSDASIKKITEKTVINSKNEYEKTHINRHQKVRVLGDSYVLMKDDKFKSVSAATMSHKPYKPKKSLNEGMGEN